MKIIQITLIFITETKKEIRLIIILNNKTFLNSTH